MRVSVVMYAMTDDAEYVECKRIVGPIALQRALSKGIKGYPTGNQRFCSLTIREMKKVGF
ncbi:hypothetical protein [Peribacillus butanolivorans]|uniref:hypothetical protein n=1 Tax=Peribacillus butanolivorans TaxID=421767 RepID=UPI00381EBDCC